MSDKCQQCGCKAIARCTGKTSDLFGIIWPGGKEQSGYVPPHRLTGLREAGASSDYMNFSWCLVCGQIQGEWPTQVGVSHLTKYAEPRYWQVVVCTVPRLEDNATLSSMCQWYSIFFSATHQAAVEKYLKKSPPECEHWFVRELEEGETVPGDATVTEL